MSSLLELRERLKVIYGRNDVYIIPVVKFLLTFLALNMINGHMGYMSRLDDLPLVLIVSLLGSFLPNGCILLFAAVFSLLHLYELSMEVALVGLCLYLVICFLYLRFAPKDAIAVLLTPMLCSLGMPYIMPITIGLLATPASAISVGCGMAIYYFLHNVVENAQAIGAMEAEETVAKLQLVLDVLLHNRPMMVMIVAAAVTITVVYLIRRLSVDYAWTIAIVTGSIVNLVVLLIGDLKYDTNMSMSSALLGTLLAVLVAKVVEFFRFCVDYNRTENVQFEDDEYYYYVKAVPKMSVAAQSRTVKKINSQKRSSGNRQGRSRRERNVQENRLGEKLARRRSVTINGMEDSEDFFPEELTDENAGYEDGFEQGGYEEEYAGDGYAEGGYEGEEYEDEGYEEEFGKDSSSDGYDAQ